MNIESYPKADGKTYYKFRINLEVDPLTGQKIQTVRRGFDSKKKAETAYTRLKLEHEGQGLREKKRFRFKEVYDE